VTSGTNNVGHGVVLFHSVSHALRAERIAMRAGLEVKLIPVPRQFSSNCGTALRFRWPKEATIRQALQEARVTIEAIQRLE
jgi:uncharacterized SAM-binding protein YcdF (DUF218 family)